MWRPGAAGRGGVFRLRPQELPNGGSAGGDAWPVRHAGWKARPPPGIAPDRRGYEKLALKKIARRMAQKSASRTNARNAYGAVGALLSRSDPENPGTAEIAMSPKYVLRYGRKGVWEPGIQRQIWRGAVLGHDEGIDAKAICPKLLSKTVARRMTEETDRMEEAGNLPI